MENGKKTFGVGAKNKGTQDNRTTVFLFGLTVVQYNKIVYKTIVPFASDLSPLHNFLLFGSLSHFWLELIKQFQEYIKMPKANDDN